MKTQNTGPLVYVMTPVYNGETYLRECIESVLAQTYSNWVYTLVNNCSTDRTLKIAREYAARDTRIRVHDNRSFLPVIDNHNLAYSLIPPESKYCKPLMADDLLFPECISEMVRVAEGNPSVGLVCMSWSWSDGGQMWDGPPGTFVSGHDICRAVLLDKRPLALTRNVFGSPTNQLIRSDLIRKRQPFCNPSNLHADYEACFDILQESDCGFVHRSLAFHRLHKKNISSQIRGLETTLLANLTVSVKFGSVYLTGQEHQEKLKCDFGDYYRVLARHFLRGREPQFWDLHRHLLMELGYSLDEERLKLAVSEVKPWQDRVDQVMERVIGIVPDTKSFILVDDQECYTDEFLAGRHKIPFLERDGEYWGAPEDDVTAIRELKRLRQSGADYIIFAWPAFWWLDYYTGFHGYLDSEFSCILKNDNLVIFDLRPSGPGRGCERT